MGSAQDEIGRLNQLPDGGRQKAVVEFRAAAGGSEAEIWANDLYRVSYITPVTPLFCFVTKLP